MMKGPATIIIFIALAGLILGGILLASPPKTQAPTSQNAQPTVIADASKIYRDGGPRIGPDNAKVKIAVFTDYLCPYCKQTHETINAILAAHPNDVTLYHRNFIVHPQAQIMAQASEAASKQGKFKEADEAIFEKYQTGDEATMEKMAQDIGLNLDQFKQDINSSSVTDAVNKDNSDALAMSLGGTPSIFVNGTYLENPADLETTVNSLLK